MRALALRPGSHSICGVPGTGTKAENQKQQARAPRTRRTNSRQEQPACPASPTASRFRPCPMAAQYQKLGKLRWHGPGGNATCWPPTSGILRMHDILISVWLGIVEGLTEFLPVSSTGASAGGRTAVGPGRRLGSLHRRHPAGRDPGGGGDLFSDLLEGADRTCHLRPRRAASRCGSSWPSCRRWWWASLMSKWINSTLAQSRHRHAVHRRLLDRRRHRHPGVRAHRAQAALVSTATSCRCRRRSRSAAARFWRSFPASRVPAPPSWAANCWAWTARRRPCSPSIWRCPPCWAPRSSSCYKKGASSSHGQGLDIAIGFVVSFVVAYFVIREFLVIVARYGLTPFGWYRIAAGAGAGSPISGI